MTVSERPLKRSAVFPDAGAHSVVERFVEDRGDELEFAQPPPVTLTRRRSLL